MKTEGITRLGEGPSSQERPTMTVVGCGGAGCNTLGRAAERGLQLGSHVACNTDAQHLLTTRAHRKVLLGRMTTYGRGANADIALGERACLEASGKVREALVKSDVCVILSGLGGGTGSGAAPVVAGIARKSGSLTLSMSTLPFSIEGSTRRSNAKVGQAALALEADLSVVLPNDKLLETSPNLGLLEAFRVADESLLEPVRLLRRVLTSGDVVHLRRVFRRAGPAHLGRGRSNRRRGYGRALADAIADIYPPVAPRACDRALVFFETAPSGPRDRELLEYVRSLHLSMTEGAETLWGIHRDPSMAEDIVAVLMLAAGPKR
jgi:cell division protein FtsZ